MTQHEDFLDEIRAEDPANRQLAASLQTWRDRSRTAPPEPDERLRFMFSQSPAASSPARWRQWLERPAFAFAASFALVLALGVGAFALVANDDSSAVAAPTTSALSARQASALSAGQIGLPEDLSEQTGYATCVFEQVRGWLDDGFTAESAPQILSECGSPPIPDLGPDAEAFRADLQIWANCAAQEVQELLPQLPSFFGGTAGEPADPLADCGEPPDPTDYGLELPFLDFESIDPSQFDFGPFNLDEFRRHFEKFAFEGFDLDELLGLLPDGALDGIDLESLDPEQLHELISGLDFHAFANFGDFELDFSECDDLDQPPDDVDGIEDLEHIDLAALFRGLDSCLSGQLGGLNFGALLNGIDGGSLESIDLESLLQELDIENLIGELDLGALFAELIAVQDFDLGSLFQDLETGSS